eukprot:30033-Pelagococcus_subviridis.AAC.2
MCWRFLATRSNRAGHRARRDERSRERALGEVHQTLHLRGFEIRVGDELLLSHRLQRADPRLQQHRLQLRRLRPGLCVVDAAARGFRANHSRRPRATPRNRPLFPLPRLRRRARPLRRRGHPVDLIPLVQNLPGLFHEIHRSSLLQPARRGGERWSGAERSSEGRKEGRIRRRSRGERKEKERRRKNKRSVAPETSNEIVVRPRGALRGVEVPRGPVRDAVVVDLRAPRPRRVRSRVPGSASRDPDEAVRVLRKVVSIRREAQPYQHERDAKESMRETMTRNYDRAYKPKTRERARDARCICCSSSRCRARRPRPAPAPASAEGGSARGSGSTRGSRAGRSG